MYCKRVDGVYGAFDIFDDNGKLIKTVGRMFDIFDDNGKLIKTVRCSLYFENNQAHIKYNNKKIFLK